MTVSQERRRTARFMNFGSLAAMEALHDAGWHPQSDLEQEMTVWSPMALATLLRDSAHTTVRASA